MPVRADELLGDGVFAGRREAVEEDELHGVFRLRKGALVEGC